MIATGFDEQNTVLHPPEGWTADECEALSACSATLDDGSPIVVTCWKPTAGEWEEMRKTGRVWLVVWGMTQPPVAVVGRSPFRREGSPE